MDADIVKEVEFSRKMRGYDMGEVDAFLEKIEACLLYTSPSPRDIQRSRMPSSA